MSRKDSGSRHSFINLALMTLSQLKTEKTTPLIVRTDCGATMLSDSKCERLKFKLQKHEFEVS